MKYRFSTALNEMDIDLIHGFLVNSYWAKGISRDVLERALRNSLNFALFDQQKQISFGRFITDKATYAYLADVFVLEEYQCKGLGSKMVSEGLQLPDLVGVRRIMLATRDAHTLYKRLGFSTLDDSSIFMQKWWPDIYQR